MHNDCIINEMINTFKIILIFPDIEQVVILVYRSHFLAEWRDMSVNLVIFCHEGLDNFVVFLIF